MLRRVPRERFGRDHPVEFGRHLVRRRASRFVHVREADRALSLVLQKNFLPVRRYMVGCYLCNDLVEPALEPAPQPKSAPHTLELAWRRVPVATVTENAQFLDDLVLSLCRMQPTDWSCLWPRRRPRQCRRPKEWIRPSAMRSAFLYMT